MAQTGGKKIWEIKLFENFASAAGIQIVAGSIIQPDPRPDIVCEIVGRGRVGFELTALDARSTQTTSSLLSRTRQLWLRSISDLEQQAQVRLRKLHSDVDVGISYVGGVSSTKTWSEALSAVLKRLSEADASYAGDLYDTDDLRPPGIRQAIVHRNSTNTNGPVPSVMAQDTFAPIDWTRIEDKLKRKDYLNVYPVDLLAYTRYGGAMMLMESQCVMELDALTRNLDSPFSQIWIFSFPDWLIARYPVAQ